VWAARHAYRLPYFHARMRAETGQDGTRFSSVRTSDSGPAASLDASYRSTGLPTDDPLARWLAERYCLYVVDENGDILRGEIHHPPWPLEAAAGELDPGAMASPLGITLEGKPLLHYSRRQDVAFWSLARA
jgi:uncharacterized protein